MATYSVTFGQRFPREPHSSFPGAHRDGWVEIEADNESDARALAFEWLGREWSSMYDGPGSAVFYPLGCLARCRRADDGSVVVEEVPTQGERDGSE